VILVTLALFLVMLEKQSHQIKTLIRLELVTLVVLVTLDRQKIFEEFMACKKQRSRKYYRVKVMSPTSPMSPEYPKSLI
jgi:hypothetical protein